MSTIKLADLRPESRVLLSMLSLLQEGTWPWSIPERLFTQLFETKSDGPLQPYVPHALQDEKLFVGAVEELVQYKLVERSPNSNDNKLHYLSIRSHLQDGVFNNVESARPQHKTVVFQAVVSLLTQLWPFSDFESESQLNPLQGPLFFPVLALYTRYEKLTRHTTIKMDIESRRRFARLLVHAGW